MTLSRHGILVALACLPMLLASAGAYADAPGWYAGADLGNSDYSSLDKNIGYAYSSAATGWSVLGGYQFNDWFGLEGTYFNMGNTSVLTALGDFGFNGNVKLSGESVDAVFSSSQQGLGVFGKIGAALARVDTSFTSGGVPAGSSRASDAVPDVGVGLTYGTRGGWTWRLGWTQYNNVGDNSSGTGRGNVNFGYLSVLYRF